jgi:hypothetical protein
MQITIGITWRRLILGGILAALLIGILVLRLMFPAPNTAIAGRNSIRARLAIPKDLREFPVEQYITHRDWLVYRSGPHPLRSRRWRLDIICKTHNPDEWCRAFRRYLQTRGEYYERGGDITLPGQVRAFQMQADSGGSAVIQLKNVSGQLQITFEYRKAIKRSRIWRTRFGRCVAEILLKAGLRVDGITCPS